METLSDFNTLCLAGLAFIMGFLASAATVASFWTQRIHNRLSVRPIAEVLVGDYEDRLVVVLENKGIGPLIIKKFLVKNEMGSEKNSVIEFFETGFSDVVWKMFITDLEGLAILPGERKVLLELIGNPTDEEFASKRNRVRRLLGTLEATIHYKDIYGKLMPKKVRKFNFFRRHETVSPIVPEP